MDSFIMLACLCRIVVFLRLFSILAILLKHIFHQHTISLICIWYLRILLCHMLCCSIRLYLSICMRNTPLKSLCVLLFWLPRKLQGLAFLWNPPLDSLLKLVEVMCSRLIYLMENRRIFHLYMHTLRGKILVNM